MKNKNLLIGAVAVVVGYLLYKKSQSKVNQTKYSKECYDELKSRLMQEDAKPANFQKDFLERCQKITNEANLQVKNNSIDPREAECNKQGGNWEKVEKFCKNRGGNAMPIVELDWSILNKIPNEFTVKSNGFNTRYYKNIDKNLTGFASLFSVPELYKQPYSTTGFSGVMPTKISTREFSDAYSQFLKQPK